MSGEKDPTHLAKLAEELNRALKEQIQQRAPKHQSA
jgi:hypothetical protein